LTENIMSTEDLERVDSDLEDWVSFGHSARVAQINPELSSVYSTPDEPDGRRGSSFRTAIRWLLAWLRNTNISHCPITLVPISVARVVEIAHMMLPQSAPRKAVIMIGSILAMHQFQMSVNSRVFLMPLRSDVHMLVKTNRIFMIAPKELLQNLEDYLLTLESDASSSWSQLRKGSLEQFKTLKDGYIRDYKLLCSPHFDDQHTLNHGRDHAFKRPYLGFPLIKTHVHPFAISIHALAVLERPNSPITSDFFRPRTREDFLRIQDLVERALLGLTTKDDKPDEVPQSVRDHAQAFENFARAFDGRAQIVQSRQNSKFRLSISDSSSALNGRAGSARHSLHSDGGPPSTSTPSGHNSEFRAEKDARSSSPTPASEVKENDLADRSPPSPPPKATRLVTRFFRRFLSFGDCTAEPKEAQTS
jgi:hypothetical protein